MPNPVGSDVHVNQPLTSISVAYGVSKDTYIADKVFPTIKCDKRSDLYRRWSKSDLRRTDVKRRAPGTETPGTGSSFTWDTFYCHTYGLHEDIDDQRRANDDDALGIDARATKRITDQMYLYKELAWAASYFKPGIWGTEFQGVSSATPGSGQFTQWDNATSDPISFVDEMKQEFALQSGGREPNVMVAGQSVFRKMKQHPLILDLYKYTRGGVLTQDLLASVLGVDKLYVPKASYTDVGRGIDMETQDAQATYNWIFNPNDVLWAYTPSAPAVDEPAAGYTFTWTGYVGGSGGHRIKKFRQELIAADRIEIESSFDFRVVCKDMGLYLKDVVS